MSNAVKNSRYQLRKGLGDYKESMIRSELSKIDINVRERRIISLTEI